MKIGIFDSGFGGMSVLRGIVKKLPDYSYLYCGDTARMPYGPRSPEEIYEFTRQAVDFLFRNDCALIILACNTASSDALRKIQEEYLLIHYPERRVLGVLIPAAEEAARYTHNKKIGVIGTEATVASEAFIREIKKINPAMSVFQKACPQLVPLIESGNHTSLETKKIIEQYLFPLIKTQIDTLILGCTHYGLIEQEIKDIVGPSIHLISEESIVPEKLAAYLSRHENIRDVLGKDREMEFYTTGFTDRFTTLGSLFFGEYIQAKQTVL